MGLDFLRDHGGRRVRSQPDLPELDLPDDPEEGRAADEDVDPRYESGDGPWRPIAVDGARDDPAEAPRRFIDGCHVGHTIAWLQDAEGHPIPLMLAEIGGVCVEADGRELRRAFQVVERVVSLIVDPFPWDEVEAFAVALAGSGFRLLPTAAPKAPEGRGWAASFDFEAMRKKAQNRSNYEMEILEEVALCQDAEVPTVVDGRLEPRINSDMALQRCPVVGVVKTQRRSYLHAEGWRVYYRLEPGQRTPAFLLKGGAKEAAGPATPREGQPDRPGPGADEPRGAVPVVSWYLKLDGAHGAMPNWGVVRVEIPQVFFEECVAKDFGYIDRLSRSLIRMRCRQESYRRGPVSLAPIVRAEEVLRALFAPPGYLIQHFYRLTGI